MDMSHVLVIAPLVVFALFFLTILLLRSFFLMSKEEQRRDRVRRGMRSSSSNDTVFEISCNNNYNSQHGHVHRASSNSTRNQPSPPSYYAEVMATNSSALYPVYVPPYAAPLMTSLRDPRQFNGLPGIAAPPPYPPPPSYNQISAFPELPTAPHAIVDISQQPRITKKRLEVTPVE